MGKLIDKKLFLILMGYVSAYKTVTILQELTLNYLENKVHKNIEWFSIIIQQLIPTAVTITPIVFIILVVTKIMINRNYKWLYIIIIHFTLSWVYGLLVTLSGVVYLTITEGGTIAFSKSEIISQLVYSSSRDFLGYVGFVSIIYSYYYINRTIKIEIQKAQLSEQLINIKMEALKSQLNPHFLFNTLNSISALIIEDQKKAQDMIAYLGDLLREVLIIKNENLIPIHQEISILNKYLDIMRIRFSDHLNIDIEIQEDIEKVLIPSMIIQPIIENSFKHGYSYNVENLKIKLSISKEDDKLLINITNNGEIIACTTSSGMGIKNIKDRLHTLYNKNFDFIFRNLKNNNGVETIMKIPLEY
ncbi:sensor histidine kinase [Aquimarina litoralis]|uniref:sensor histidine kinase n=1 Tax=Aquimarina litoralis TaxID=584605 RepID=UPI001C55CCA4|nr:histidine kinase [Aquimarina litoralis]MBW1297647.1 histidine kinase [Aquimarina litoralis]